MNDERGESKIGGLGWGFGGMLVIYFGFPALWMWPFWRVYGMNTPEWLDPAIFPVKWLGHLFPVYKQWVITGIEWLGIK